MNLKRTGFWLLVVMQSGCSVWVQEEGSVLVREPANSSYDIHDNPTEVAQYAQSYWPYVALAANAYNLSWPDYQQKIVGSNQKADQRSLEQLFTQACKPHSNQLIPTPGWYGWPAFPSQALADRAEKAKLFFSVWEFRGSQSSDKVTEVAIVFRGTEADQRQDWFSNARWFIPTWLRGEDQYDVAKNELAKEFEAEIQKRIAEHKLPATVKITSVGHSLGGGLAQQLAYALPRSAPHPVKVSKVIAFNSSPVTGWLSTANPPRDENTKGLEIDRVFEHGEALAYVRLPINIIVPPNKRDSYVKDLRFNLRVVPGGVSNHGSQFFACRLAEVAGATKGTINTKSFASEEEVKSEVSVVSAVPKK
ncbi:hypothetical protein PZ739_10775 [Pseudomonas kermanshahensis]|uniref:lipase family protein n=1 Tax=Pseudomonas kermanshahensis TaxID=2745482 RepID=UPI0023D9CE0E|nr:DUF6792 domain-containing protein [Pseudomonas kermanshahensis]WEL57606.1 hypothetical protein PZ739_10775 [Pseudomonas kermanshahensis]